VSAALILWVALSMIREARGGIDKTKSCMLISFKNIVVLAFATSLDALAVGFSMSITGTAAPKLAAAAGLITFFALSVGRDVGRQNRRKDRRPRRIFRWRGPLAYRA